MCDRPTANGRMYLREEVEEAISKLKTLPLLGRCGSDGGMNISLTDVAFTVENLRFNEYNCLIADIKTLETPMGKTFEPLLDLCEYTTVGTGMLNDKDGTVSDFKLSYISAIPKQVNSK